MKDGQEGLGIGNILGSSVNFGFNVVSNEGDLQRPIVVAFSNADSKGIAFLSCNIEGADILLPFVPVSLSHSRLIDCHFVLSKGMKGPQTPLIEGCNFQNARFYNCHFTEPGIISSSFFENAIFENCTFSGITFLHCSMANTRFYDCCFTACEFRSSVLENASFLNCELRDVELLRLSMDYSQFSGCVLSGCSISIRQLFYIFGTDQILNTDSFFKNDSGLSFSSSEVTKILPRLYNHFIAHQEYFPALNILNIMGKEEDLSKIFSLSVDFYSTREDFSSLSNIIRLTHISLNENIPKDLKKKKYVDILEEVAQLREDCSSLLEIGNGKYKYEEFFRFQGTIREGLLGEANCGSISVEIGNGSVNEDHELHRKIASHLKTKFDEMGIANQLTTEHHSPDIFTFLAYVTPDQIDIAIGLIDSIISFTGDVVREAGAQGLALILLDRINKKGSAPYGSRQSKYKKREATLSKRKVKFELGCLKIFYQVEKEAKSLRSEKNSNRRNLDE